MKRAPALLLFFLSPAASGGALDDEYLRFGGGFGSVQVQGTVHDTLQFFAGLDAAGEGAFRVGAEAGAMEAGDSGADGLWAAGFANWTAAPDVSFFARGGVDFGGDPGWLAGAGVGYFIERNMEVRFEMVSRQLGSGLQFNLAWYPRLSPFP